MNSSAMLAWMPHLLRPLWLLALLGLPALWWLWRLRARTDTPWKGAVDPHLLPSLLEPAPGSNDTGAWLFTAAYALAVVALTGPAWRQPVALYAPQAPLVVVLDLSSHMLVADLVPSRLMRARLKIQQLIALRKGGQIGLIAYAGDAFTVAPLSDDANSLRDLLPALTPDTMPIDGQRADTALHRATDLLVQTGFARGTILLFSDNADAAAAAAAREARAKGYEVDAMGIGTPAGAPLPAADGTFAQDATGALQIARLDVSALQTLTQAGGGRYAGITASAEDLNALGVLDSAIATSAKRVAADSLGWRDDGPFLLLALLPLVALGFRRGWLAVALLAVFALPVQRVEASESNVWGSLWQRADQRADHALRAGDAVTASALAQTPAQRAAASYRKGDYATAATSWSTLDGADAQYNRGNALAQLKRYADAIAAYHRALQLRPQMADAQANLKLVEQLQRQQQQKEQQQQNQQQQGQQQDQHDDKKQDQNGHSTNQENMQKSQQQGQQQNPDQQGKGEQQGKDAQRHQNPLNEQAKDQQQNRKPNDREQQNQEQKEQSQQPAPDPKQQAQADAAERRAMQQALQRKNQLPHQPAPVVAPESTAQREQRQTVEALLQRVPDDPGGLLRRKFALEYARRQQEGQK